jgi:hypothetical protein
VEQKRASKGHTKNEDSVIYEGGENETKQVTQGRLGMFIIKIAKKKRKNKQGTRNLNKVENIRKCTHNITILGAFA